MSLGLSVGREFIALPVAEVNNAMAYGTDMAVREKKRCGLLCLVLIPTSVSECASRLRVTLGCRLEGGSERLPASLNGCMYCS